MDLLLETLLVLVLLLAIGAAAVRLGGGGGGRLPPGPRGLPLLGSLLSLDPLAPHRSLAALARRYGPAFSLRLGGVRVLVLADAGLVRRALEQDACAGRAPLFLTHGIMHGHGIICAEGERWREQRRFVASCLRGLGMVRVGARRDRLETRIAAGAADLVRRLEAARAAAEGEPLDPAPALLHCVGSVVTGAVLGRQWDADDPTWRWLLHTQEEGTRLIGIAGAINFLPWLRFLPRYRRTLAHLTAGQARQHGLFRSLAAELAADTPPDEHVLAAYLAEQRRRAGRGAAALGSFTDRQLPFLLADLFGAGLDTTAVSLRWFLLLMATHPQEQARVQEELDAVSGGRAPSLADAPALPRLHAALAEAQRLRPVVPVGIPHGVTQRTRLADWDLPAGTMVMPLLWALHHDPQVFPEPERFRPQRFLGPDGRFEKPAAFLPFQTGKRMCVGEHLANMLLLLFGGAVLAAFTLRPEPGPPPDLEGECGITLAPAPHRLLLAPRRPRPAAQPALRARYLPDVPLA